MKNSIFELMAALPPIVEIAITCFSKNQILFPLKDGTYSLQMVWYWWKAADTDLAEGNQDSIVHGEEEPKQLMPKSPTLISTQEQIDYLNVQLKSLVKEAEEYLGNTTLPPSVQYKVERGYDRLMEAMFNMETANSHYGELNKRR